MTPEVLEYQKMITLRWPTEPLQAAAPPPPTYRYCPYGRRHAYVTQVSTGERRCHACGYVITLEALLINEGRH